MSTGPIAADPHGRADTPTRGAAGTSRPCRSHHPVIIATGEKSLDELDFELPGPIPLRWRRRYRSGDARGDGWFGQGWSHALATELRIEDDVLHYWDPQGREVVLPAIDVGQQHFESYEQFTLTRPAAHHWALRYNDGLTHHFRQRHTEQRRLPLEVMQDRNLRRIALQFASDGLGADFRADATMPRPQRLVDSAGRVLHLLWTPQGQLAQVIAETDGTRTVLASYRFGGATDQHPDLLEHTDPNGHTRTYAWKQHLLVGYTLATGQRFRNRYDRLLPSGRVTESLALDDGTGDWFDYHGRTTRVRDRLGRETVYVHNARQDVVAVHDAQGHVTRTDFDALGRAESSTDALGHTSSRSVDARGNTTQMVDAAGNTTTVAYDALDLPTLLTDAMGAVWQQRYDTRGNLVASTDPLGHTTRFEVDALGQTVAIVDALGKRKTLQWDEAGNLVAYTDCSGYTTRLAYDALGNLTSETDALGQRTDYTTDAMGQPLEVVRPDGSIHRYGWDGQGNLARYTDPKGQTIHWAFNGAGHPLLRVDELGHTLRYHYDAAGRLVRLVNENGDTTHFGWDAADNLTDDIGFDGRHLRYAYDAAGRSTHVIERGGSRFGPGKVTRIERDVLGRMVAKHHLGETPGQSASSRFAYDALDRLVQASNAVSDVQLAYDPLGRLVQESQELHGPFGRRSFAFQHAYDALGNRIHSVLPGGRHLHQLFYGPGHLHQIHLNGQVVSDFERDMLHREVRRSQGRLHSGFNYDAVGRLSVQQVVRATAEAPATAPQDGPRSAAEIERRYTYDACGQLVQRLDLHRGRNSHSYDAAGRIVRSQIGLPAAWQSRGLRTIDASATDGRPAALTEQFRWDPASNPVTAVDTDHGVASLVGNRLRVWQDTRYRYDAHGNLVERLQGKRGSAAQARMRLHWDDAHQLIRADVARGPDDGATVQSFHYAYDALGRRIAKTDAFGSTHFAWDGDLLALEQRGGKEIVHLYHPDSFVPLAQVHDGAVHHLHTDHLGTPLEASNDAGDITWRVTYRTWGNVLVEEVAGIEQKLRFQGQYFDTETGLHYNRFRYYEPEVGRFISLDPIGLIGGFNLYQHSPAPTVWIDPLGLAGSGGAYFFQWEKGGKYIGKGTKPRMNASKRGRKRTKNDCLLGEAHVSTGGDNELGKMVEYRAMCLSGFTPGAIPAGFANSILSGKSAWENPANASKRAAATRKAKELIQKFEDDAAAKAAAKCGNCP